MAVIVKGVTSSGGGAKIATILNDDGTQSLLLSDKDTVIDLTPLDSEINEQTDLIAQIQAELDAKAEGGGGSPSVSGEISITENGIHDVAQYATANVNVASEPVLLWENASPTSAFAAQTINLPTGYSAFLVECRGSNSKSATGVSYLPFFTGGSSLSTFGGVSMYYYDGGRSYSPVRYIKSAQDGAIAFDLSSNGGGEAYAVAGLDGYLAIPTRIWGVKFTF